jgi:hypothetical protein
MLNAHTLPRSLLIVRFVFCAEFSTSGFLLRDAAVGMQFVDVLIALILQTFAQWMNVNARGFEEFEVMSSPFAKECADDLLSLSINHQLAFERVIFLLARIESTLPSQGVSYCRRHHQDMFVQIVLS